LFLHFRVNTDASLFRLSIGFFTVFLASPFIGLYSKIYKDLKWLTIVAFIFFAAFFGPCASPCLYRFID
jgi:hypothetical protein